MNKQIYEVHDKNGNSRYIYRMKRQQSSYKAAEKMAQRLREFNKEEFKVVEIKVK